MLIPIGIVISYISIIVSTFYSVWFTINIIKQLKDNYTLWKKQKDKLQLCMGGIMKKIYAIRQIIVAFMAFVFLTWAFFQNEWWARIIISPFIICSFAIIMERLFFLLNKIK